MKISIVTPVYNDWNSLSSLIKELNIISKDNNIDIDKIIVVNDGSFQQCPPEILITSNIDILNIATNVGHQRAISIGLCYVNEKFIDTEKVIVMDSDGEDKPEDIIKLLNESDTNGSSVVFAERFKRSEGFLFRYSYTTYKILFKLLTGDKIRFGNFCCVQKNKIENIISNPDSWNHFSGSVMKSKLDYSYVPTERGKRYFGTSKMNFTSLIMHGLSSISLYIERIVVRLLILNVIFVLLSFILLSIIFCIKIFSDYSIPGWTPIYTLGIFNILLFSTVFTLILVLTQLGNRNVVKTSPKLFYKSFILEK